MTQVTFWKSELFPWLRYCFSWYAWAIGLYLDRRHRELWIHFLCFSLRINYHWSFYIGNDPLGGEEDAVMFVWQLVHWRGRRIDLHVMVKPDGDNCYHSHPARAIRVPIWGGYVEEIIKPLDNGLGLKLLVPIHPWTVSRVEPEFIHRLAGMPHGRNISLWFRGVITHEIDLVRLRHDGAIMRDTLARQES